MAARRTRLLAAIALAGLSSAALAAMAVADSPPSPPGHAKRPTRDVCTRPAWRESGQCHAKVVTKADEATPAASFTPPPGAYTPADLRSAYGLASGPEGTGQTIAIVVAYDNPNAESDLAVYRSQFGLPPCTTNNGCFRKVNQNGVQGSYPVPNVSWAQESALDLDMASAICPNCKLLLVEATSNFFSDLALAVDRAAALGANVISNSYGAAEFAGVSTWEARYNKPGIAVTVSSGDIGFRVEFPASSRHVTAVGGTRLVRASNARGWSETAWSGAGSGCSSYIAKPAWQTDTGCARRTVADVSAVADPNTGVAVYASYGSGGLNWFQFGGTSVSAPIIGGLYALGGNAANLTYGSLPYSRTSSLNDVTSGSNGSCSGSYLCTAVAGYDGPTGLGTPRGIGAFGGPVSPTGPTTTTTTTTTTTLPPTTTTSTSSTTTTTRAPTTTTTRPPTTTTTVAGGQPSAPTYVTASQSGSPGVLVYWYPPSSYGCGSLTGYRIYRSTTSGTQAFLASVGAVYTYQDSATTAGVRYYYRVSAVNACGEGPRSAEVSAVAR